MPKNIYLARQSESFLYKIGITKNSPKSRIKQLQVGNAMPLELVTSFITEHDYKMEAVLHSHFISKRREGEWFELSDQEVIDFENICKEKETMIGFLKQNNHFWG